MPLDQTQSGPPAAALRPRLRDARLAALLGAAEELEEGTPPRLARAIVVIVLLLLAGFVAGAAVTPVAERARAQGEILPLGFSRPVQHPEGGVIAEVLVTEGEAVAAGAPIARLEGAQARAELAQAELRAALLDQAAARLREVAGWRDATALAMVRSPQAEPALPQPQLQAWRDQVALREAQLESRRQQALGITSEINAREAVVQATARQIDRSRAELALIGGALDRRTDLARSGLARVAELEALQRDQLRQEGEIARLEAELSGARLAVAQLSARLAESLSRQREEALAELLLTARERAGLEPELDRLRERAARLLLTAPVTGVVRDLAVHGAGAVVAAGATVALVVPTDPTVYADVELLPQDAGLVRPGLRAELQVAAYDHTRYGTLPAEVAVVLPGSTRQQDGRILHRARLRLLATTVGRGHGALVVGPGMVVTAQIRTGEKTLLAYLLKPMRVIADSSFGER